MSRVALSDAGTAGVAREKKEGAVADSSRDSNVANHLFGVGDITTKMMTEIAREARPEINIAPDVVPIVSSASLTYLACCATLISSGIVGACNTNIVNRCRSSTGLVYDRTKRNPACCHCVRRCLSAIVSPPP